MNLSDHKITFLSKIDYLILSKILMHTENLY